MPEENSEKGARGQGRPFQKGQSGNPKGRPKGVPNRATRDIRAMAQAMTLGDPRFVARLQRQLRSGTCHPSLVQALLAYGYGKPMERVESVTIDLAAMLERIEQRDAAGARPIGPVPKHPRDPRPPLVLSATAESIEEDSNSTRADEPGLDDSYPDEIILPVEVRHPAPPIVQRSAQVVQQPHGGEARRAAWPTPYRVVSRPATPGLSNPCPDA